jgi:radical SAM superfamily enzyme YgiQ (UPF0313 family)
VSDVLLTHSYHLAYDRKQARKMQPYPPLATLYAAAVLRKMGFSLALFDTMLKDPVEGFSQAMAAHRPKIVVVYEDDFNFLSKMCLTRMREVAWQMAQDAKGTNAIVIAHGSDASDNTEAYLRAGFDFVLLGESEFTLAEMCDLLLSGRDAHFVPGIAALDSSGEVVRNAPRHATAARSHFPWPARDLIDLGQYRQAWKKTHGRFSLNLISSRGCPFRCNWCAKPIFGDGYSARPAEDVADEVSELTKAYGAEHLWFADDIFGLNRHWVADFSNALTARNATVAFKIQSRADLMTPGTADALRRAGCEEVWMGVESGAQSVLDSMDKGLRVEEVVAARESLRANSVRACYFLQFGYPGETWANILATRDIVRGTRPDDVGISFSYPLPGTRFHARVKEQLGTKRNWADSDDLCVMFKGAYTDQFYRAIRDAIHAEVSSWNGSGPRLSRMEIDRMWMGIEERERSSRNPDATVLQPSIQNKDPHIAADFVSLAHLSTPAGANFD